MLEDFLEGLYPALHERAQLPPWYSIVCMILAILPFLLPRSPLLLFSNTAVLLALCIGLPAYTFGDVSSDYYSSGMIWALPLWYIDFVLCTPWDGPEAPAYLGRSSSNKQHKPRAMKDARGLLERAIWAVRLMIPGQRGIGWNWQVKGIPHDPYEHKSRTKRAALHILWTFFYYAQSVVMLVVLGWANAARQTSDVLIITIANTVLAWSGAIWVWDRLCCAYSAAACVSIVLCVSDPWEWPPLMGPIEDAWSVRQMWSAVYHQAFRRLFSKPAQRFARLLHLRKGTLASSYAQLFATFAISCLFHQLQMYTAAHALTREFSFFYSQAVAITAEDLVQWLANKSGIMQQASIWPRYVGYTWVFLWLSYCLPTYLNGLLHYGIIDDWIMHQAPLVFGASLCS